MVDDSSTDSSNRIRELGIPARARSEEEYEALREAHRNPEVDPDVSFSFWEQSVRDTAREFDRWDADPERLLRILRQPSSDFGLSPEDVYPDAVGEPRFPEEGVRFEFDEIRWLRDASREVRERLENEGVHKSSAGDANTKVSDSAGDTTDRSRVHSFLSGLEDFCDVALDIGVRPEMTRY